MQGTVKVPGVGPVKKSWAAGGAAILVAILGIAYWRHRNASSSSSSASAAPAATGTAGGAGSSYTPGGDLYPPDGTTGNPSDPYSTDPSTGQTYGDEAGGSYGGGYGGGGANNSGGYPVAGSYTTNAQWAQAYESYAQDSLGADAATVAAALGKYLTGGQLTQAQQTVVNQAIAFEGYPPVSGPGGFPPSMHVQPAGSGGSSDGQVVIPDVVGEELVTAQQNMSYAGLKSTAQGPAFQAGHGTRVVTSQSAKPGSKWKRGTNVVLTYKVVGAPKKK